MRKDYLAISDAALLEWSAVFLRGIEADPSGLSPEQLTLYAQAHANYAQAFAAATRPETRTSVAIAQKNDARAALKKLSRVLAQIIRANTENTNSKLIELGLSVRPETRTPIARPSEAPVISVIDSFNREMTLHVRAATMRGRGKPRGVRSARLMSFIGETPPADLSRWQLLTWTHRTRVVVSYPASVPPGTKLWICGAWLNPRNQAGPFSQAISAHVMGGVTAAA